MPSELSAYTPEILDAMAKDAADLNWRITEYNDVEGPDGRTVELNGFASVMAGGDRQRQSRARTRLVVDVLHAFPGIVATLSASESRVRELEAENASAVIAAQTEEIRALKEALDELAPWFEGEHAFDHPSCVLIRKARGL